MPIDAVDEINGLRNAYVRSRGGTPTVGKRKPDGGKWMGAAARGLVPKTTFADVIVAASHINKHMDPTQEQCIDLLMKHKGYDRAEAKIYCTLGGRTGSPRKFVRTADFLKTKRDFDSVSPFSKFGSFGMIGRMNDVYPYNEEFWGGAWQFARARNAAGVVPFWTEIATESIKEAIKEAPATISNAIVAMDPRNLVPDVSGIVKFTEFLKWASVAGGLFALYWYVLKPANDKKSS